MRLKSYRFGDVSAASLSRYFDSRIRAARRCFVFGQARARLARIPSMSESTAQGALAAALGVQRELNAAAAPLRFRIGVHLGDVIEEADGSLFSGAKEPVGSPISGTASCTASPGPLPETPYTARRCTATLTPSSATSTPR